MTPEELAAIKARAEAVNRPDRAPPLFYDTQFGHPAYALADDRDTEFWAHAREDLPALVAEVERLQALNANQAAMIDLYREERSQMKAALDELVARAEGAS